MTPGWTPLETSRHQDHVIAHVLGTTVLGFFINDEAAHLLLDIGFVWTIYADCEMALLPQAIAINELSLDATAKAELLADAALLDTQHEGPSSLKRITPAPVECLITEVTCAASLERRRVLLRGEEASLAVETSLASERMSIVAAASED
jgi:hypothetical protein